MSYPSFKMVIFHSCVSKPEGMYVYIYIDIFTHTDIYIYMNILGDYDDYHL